MLFTMDRACDLTTPRVLIVSFDSFTIGDDFILKDLALFQPYARTYWYGMFRPPMPLETLSESTRSEIAHQASSIGHNHISWAEGFYEQSFISHVLNYFAAYNSVYAVTSSQRDVLQKLCLQPISTLDTISFTPPSCQTYSASLCPEHDHLFDSNHQCSLMRVEHSGRQFVNIHSMRRFPLS